MRPAVHGLDLDPQTRCRHWHSPLDIVALKMRCCGLYWACRDCHDALADHPATLWPTDTFDTPAILCGACGGELTIRDYLECEDRCPGCGAGFNPGCRLHRGLYFEGPLETPDIRERGMPQEPPRKAPKI
jgi:uncharacterized CHY-type Zn-finger protein